MSSTSAGGIWSGSWLCHMREVSAPDPVQPLQGNDSDQQRGCRAGDQECSMMQYIEWLFSMLHNLSSAKDKKAPVSHPGFWMTRTETQWYGTPPHGAKFTRPLFRSDPPFKLANPYTSPWQVSSPLVPQLGKEVAWCATSWEGSQQQMITRSSVSYAHAIGLWYLFHRRKGCFWSRFFLAKALQRVAGRVRNTPKKNWSWSLIKT